MIYCCLCPHADETSIAAHILTAHSLTLKAYVETFPGMPVGSLAGVAETLPETKIRRSRIERRWWPAATVLVISRGGTAVRDIGGKLIRGIVTATERFKSGFAILDTDTRKLYSTPTGWVAERAPWLSCSSGWRIVKPL
jgi:hypothetical protein